MATGKLFWNGTDKVTLTADKIDASKVTGDTPLNKSKFNYTLQAMNNAFRIFYDARQLISNVSDHKVKLAMTKDLDDVGRTGWGMGVNDLEEAFDRLASNASKCKDNNVSYTGWHTDDQIGGFTREANVGYVPVPISIENFLTALNAKAKTLNAQLVSLQQSGSAVIDKVTASVGDQILPKVGTAEWSAVGTGLKRVNHAHDGIKSMLWLTSVSENSALQTSSEKLGKALGAIGKVRGAVDNFDKASRAGMGNVEAAAFAAIAEGIGAIPILGSFYQEAFQLIPGVIVGMQNIVGKRNALAAKLGVDLRIIK